MEWMSLGKHCGVTVYCCSRSYVQTHLWCHLQGKIMILGISTYLVHVHQQLQGHLQVELQGHLEGHLQGHLSRCS